MDHNQYIVERLDSARDERGMSKAELARRSDIPTKRLTSIFSGKRQLRADEFVRLCFVMSMPYQAFLTPELRERYEEAARRVVVDFGTGYKPVR